MLDKKQVFEQKDEKGYVEVSFRVRGDAIASLLQLLQHCETIGGCGHSFGIDIDQETKEYHSLVGFDGDGSDSLTDIRVNGKMVERNCFLPDKKAADMARIARRVANSFADVVDMEAKGVYIKPSIRNSINKGITALITGKYFTSVPLEDIFAILEGHGIAVVQEDGTPWSGFLTGADGMGDFDLGMDGKPVKNAVLRVMWHKMPSGRYEITAYVS